MNEAAASVRTRAVPPQSDSRQPLVVTFPSALDQGLLMRALGVMRGGEAIGAG